MKNKITVSDLIRGMNNITRMREEIGQLVSGLQGRLVKNYKPEELVMMTGRLGVVFEGGVFKWRLLVTAKGKPFVESFLEKALPNGRTCAYCSGWVNKHDDIHFEEIEFVYKGLQVLVDGLMEHFPKLQIDAKIVSSVATMKFD